MRVEPLQYRNADECVRSHLIYHIDNTKNNMEYDPRHEGIEVWLMQTYKNASIFDEDT